MSHEIAFYLHCNECGDDPFKVERHPLYNPLTGEQSSAYQNVVVSLGDSPCEDASNPRCPHCGCSLAAREG